MYIIDQHAAKERVNYEYYLEQFKRRDLRLSDMLVPIVLDIRKASVCCCVNAGMP